MSEETAKVKCPFCEGHGELTRAELAERLTNRELRRHLDARIAEILEGDALAVVGPRVRDFQKEVHSWNPTLPIWRRSPKE